MELLFPVLTIESLNWPTGSYNDVNIERVNLFHSSINLSIYDFKQPAVRIMRELAACP